MTTIDLVDCLLRVTVILIIGWLTARLMERGSPTTAHRVLVVSVLCSLLLPLVTAIVPDWHWDLPVTGSLNVQQDMPAPVVQPRPAESKDGLPQFPPAVVLLAADDIASEQRNGDDVAFAAIPGALYELEETKNDAVLANSPLDAARSRYGQNAERLNLKKFSITWSSVALVTWLTATLLFVTRFVISLRQLQRRIRHCTAASPHTRTLIDQMAADHDVRQRVHTVMSADESMPMACWLGRWVIVLPSNINTWDIDTRDAAVMHELGHAARRDAWSDYLMHGFCCLLWFHPLVWLFIRNSRRLRELACDEWVLQQTSLSNTTYARCLLQVVERCQSEKLTIASAMASPADFESRLKRLMSASFPKTRRPLATLFAAMLVGAASLTIATARPVAIAEQAQATDTQNVTKQPDADHAGEPKVIITRDPTPAEPNISASGTVTDEGGKPLAGMHVVLRAHLMTHQYAWAFPHTRDVLARATTDADGKFGFDRIGIPPRMGEAIDKLRQGALGAHLLVWGDGRGLAWRPLTGFQTADETISLSPEADVTGLVVAENGQPVPNANLSVTGITASTTKFDGMLNSTGDLRLISTELSFEATSVADGSFRFANLPPDKRVLVSSRGPLGQAGFLIIDTGNNNFDSLRSRSKELAAVHRSPVRLQTKLSAAIRVVVVDHEGNPVHGGGLEAVDSERHRGGQATVDENGHAILVVNAPGVHKVSYGHDPLMPMIGVQQTIDIQNGEIQMVTLTLPHGRMLTGKVIDAQTGQPIPGAYVQCTNKDVFADRKRTDAVTPTGSMGVSEANGVFRVAVTTGQWRLSLRHDIDGYLAASGRAAYGVSNRPNSVEVTVTDGHVPDDAVIRVGRGLIVSGMVLNEQGTPLPDVAVRIENQGNPYRTMATTSDDEGNFRFGGISPYVENRVSAATQSGVAEQTIKAIPKHPWEQTVENSVTLKIFTGTTLTGRVVYEGQPMQGVRMRLARSRPADRTESVSRYHFLAETVTDKDGRYSVSGLQKDDQYHFEVAATGNLAVRDWKHQLPYVPTITAEDGATLELPDAILLSNRQTLRGQVLNRNGKPVAGITVSASLASGGTISSSNDRNAQPPWTDTDEAGRFELDGLPDEPISLMAYRANPAAGPINYSVKQSVKLGATNIRVILDPTLGSGIEDLDSE